MKIVRTILNRHWMKIALVLMFVLLSIGVVLGTRRIYRQHPEPQKLVWRRPPSDDRDNLKDQRQLKEKAREFRQYVAAEYPSDLGRLATLEDLGREAESVVIGRALRNKCRLSQNGKTVTIDYEMTVEHSYKGNLVAGKTVSVSLPGGLVDFADGTSAEIRTPWFKKMTNGKTYLLFLNSHGNRPWTTTGGPRGLFEIPTEAQNRKVSSHSMIEGDPMRSYNDTDVIVFLRAVKQSVARTR